MYNGGKRRKNWSSGNSSWKKSSLAEFDKNLIGVRDESAAGGRVAEDRQLNSRSAERGRTKKCLRENHGKDFAIMNPRRFKPDDKSASCPPKTDNSSLDGQKEQTVDRITMERMYFYFGMNMFLESNTQVSLQAEMNPDTSSSSGSIPASPGHPQRSLRWPSQSVDQLSFRSPSRLSRSWRGHMARSDKSLDCRHHHRQYGNYVGKFPGERSGIPRAEVDRGAEMMQLHLRDDYRSEDLRNRTERSCGNTASTNSFNSSTSAESGIPESCDLSSPPPWPELLHLVQLPVLQEPAVMLTNILQQKPQHLQSSGLVSCPPWRPPILSSSSPTGDLSALPDRPPSECAWYWYRVLPPTNSCNPPSGNYPDSSAVTGESSSLQEVKSSSSLQKSMAALSLDGQHSPELHGNKVEEEIVKPDDADPVQHVTDPVQHGALSEQYDVMSMQPGRTNEQVLTEFNMYRDWDYIPPLTGAASVPHHTLPRASIPRAENSTNDVISDNESEDGVIVTIRSEVL